MSDALVLNASFEPLCVVSQRRAVVLLLTSKAVALEASEATLHSERLAVGAPSVVRLVRYVRVPYRGAVPPDPQGRARARRQHAASTARPRPPASTM